MRSSAPPPSALLAGTDFDPRLWDSDQWLAADLAAEVCRGLQRELRDAMDAYLGVVTPLAQPVTTEATDPLVLVLLSLALRQWIQSPARSARLLQHLGSQLYRLHADRVKLDPLLYWTDLCGKAQRLLRAVRAEAPEDAPRIAVAAWLQDCGVDTAEEVEVVSAIHRLITTHLLRADELLSRHSASD